MHWACLSQIQCTESTYLSPRHRANLYRSKAQSLLIQIQNTEPTYLSRYNAQNLLIQIPPARSLQYYPDPKHRAYISRSNARSLLIRFPCTEPTYLQVHSGHVVHQILAIHPPPPPAVSCYSSSSTFWTLSIKIYDYRKNMVNSWSFPKNHSIRQFWCLVDFKIILFFCSGMFWCGEWRWFLDFFLFRCHFNCHETF